MTNNPTIDGVSRELRALLERVVGKPTGKPNWDALDEARIAATEELRALLDADISASVAPAVERQEPVARCRQSPVRKYLSVEFLRTHMKDGDLLYSAPPDVDALQSTIAQLRIDLGNQTELTKQADYHASQRGKEIAQLQARIAELESGRGEPAGYVGLNALGTLRRKGGYLMMSEKPERYLDLPVYRATPEVAALQSTITQLQARVHELESGRGEPVAWLNVSSGEITTCPVVVMDWDDEDEQVQSLFTAPPAPVAVVLPERRPVAATCVTRDWREGWNACLDATAALNGVKS